MSNAKQTADELFPVVKETADKLFDPLEAWHGVNQQYPMDGPTMDEQFATGGPGHILDLFGQGVKQGWGADVGGLPADVEKLLKDYGFFNDYTKGQHSILRELNETVFRGLAGGLELAFKRFPGAVIGGIGEVSPAAGAAIEAFPAGHLTGLPHVPAGAVGAVSRQALTTGLGRLEEARKLGIIGEGPPAEGARPPEVAREALAPDTTPPAAPAEPFVPEAPQAFTMRDTDIHQTARLIAPDVLKRYDTLADHHDELKALAEDVAPTYDIGGQRIPADATLAEVADTFKALKPEAYNIGGRRVPADTTLFNAEDFLRTPGPDVYNIGGKNFMPDRTLYSVAREFSPELPEAYDTKVRMLQGEIRQVERQMQELAPQVTEAYKEASRLQAAEAIAPVEPSIIPVESRSAPEIASLSQRAPTIAQDVVRQLRAAGRPAEEARAAGALQAAYYQTRAERFNGALGTARDLYAADAPAIVRSEVGGRRGSYNLRTNVTTLFRDADASTFIHETGHKYLLDLQKDATHPQAPAELLDDWQTVRGWLRAGDTLTRAQQEKFARGFERYMMEGQAPSPKLAGVFEKFRQWLSRIYQYASQLRAPLNDDIRGVYDRLLSRPNDEPVIAPEREGAEDFAAAAERSAREAPDSDALAAANAVRQERDRVAAGLSRETDSGRSDARRGPERTVVSPREGAGERTAGGGETLNPKDAPIDTGRNPPTEKSESPPTANDQFNPIGSGLTDGHGNVRLANLWVKEDIAEAIKDAVAENDGYAASRRTPMTDADVLVAADELGMRAEDLLKRRIGEAWNAEEITAGLKLMRESEANVRDAMARAETGDVKSIIDYAMARERHLLIFENLTMASSEAGRALRALREFHGITNPTLINELLQGTVGRSLKDLQIEARMGMSLNTPAQFNKYIRDMSKPGAMDMVLEIWINALLSGPYTHIRNMVGNAAVATNSIVETAGAALVSKLRGSNAVQFVEVQDRLKGLVQGSQEGMIAFAKAVRDEGYADTTKLDTLRRRAVPDIDIAGINIPLGQAIRFPGRLLEAEDKIFKAIAYRQEMNVLARRYARLEIQAGKLPESAIESRITELLRDPTEEMIAQAKTHELYQTFQNELGPLGNAVIAFANAHPLARVAIPFVRTPTNILKYALERTPFGLVSRNVRDNLLGHNGEIARDTQIARIAIGSMFMTAIAGLAYSGLITGGGPSRPEEMHTWRLDGRIPYAMRVGNTWISYANFDPVSIHMGIAADLADIARGVVEQKDVDKLATMGVTLVARDIFGKLSFRGAAQIIQTVTDPAQYGPKFMQQLAGSTVPALVGQTAQVLDPFTRDVRTTADALKARVPGFRETLPTRYDVWGNSQEQHDFGPAQYSFANNDPVSAEVNRLGMGLAYAQREMDHVALTPAQYADYARESGRLSRMLLEKMIEQPSWSRVPDGVKKTLIHGRIEAARKAIAGKVKMESELTPDSIPRQALQKRMEALH